MKGDLGVLCLAGTQRAVRTPSDRLASNPNRRGCSSDSSRLSRLVSTYVVWATVTNPTQRVGQATLSALLVKVVG